MLTVASVVYNKVTHHVHHNENGIEKKHAVGSIKSEGRIHLANLYSDKLLSAESDQVMLLWPVQKNKWPCGV